MMNKNLATYTLALSLFTMAVALSYFTIKLVEVSEALPVIVESINDTSAQIRPIANEVALVRQAIPDILTEVEKVRELVPTVVDEVAKIRLQIPAILTETQQVRNAIPEVLSEAAMVRNAIPDILTRIDNIEQQLPSIVGSVNNFSQQLAQTNQKIPDVLTEVQITRESIPPMLSRTEVMVESLGNIGKATGEDAVYGVVSGIFKAPLKVVGGLGKAIIEPFEKSATWVDDDDKKIMEELVRQLLHDDSASVYEKRNKVTNNLNRASLAETKRINRRLCKTVHVEVMSASGLYVDNKLTFCQNNDDTWQVYK